MRLFESMSYSDPDQDLDQKSTTKPDSDQEKPDFRPRTRTATDATNFDTIRVFRMKLPSCLQLPSSLTNLQMS